MFDIDEVLATDSQLSPKFRPKQGFDIDSVLNDSRNITPQSSNPAQYIQSIANQAGSNFGKGLLQTPGYTPSGMINKGAYYVGAYGPTAAGAIIGGGLSGGLLGPAAGAAAGTLARNIGQDISNQISPGSAAQKSPLQQGLEPALDAGTQGLITKAMGVVSGAIKEPAVQYVSGMTGVKPNLVQRALGNISKIFNSPSVEEAGQAIGDIAEKASIKTGTEGYKIATASLLGKEAATDEFSTATTLKMAELARSMPDALSPQEMYSIGEGLRKAMSAPKYIDPHGPFAQNFRLYAQQLASIEDRLEKIIPGYAGARSGYADALAKEALNSFMPLNKNMSVSMLKTMAMTPQAILGIGGLAAESYRAGQGKSGPAELMLSAALLSPLLVGRGIQAAAALGATRIPQFVGRASVAAGSEAAAPPLENAINSNVNAPNPYTSMLQQALGRQLNGQ